MSTTPGQRAPGARRGAPPGVAGRGRWSSSSCWWRSRCSRPGWSAPPAASAKAPAPSPSPSATASLTVPAIYQRVAPSVVTVRDRPRLGTGVIVADDGTILTADHVIAGA